MAHVSLAVEDPRLNEIYKSSDAKLAAQQLKPRNKGNNTTLSPLTEVPTKNPDGLEYFENFSGKALGQLVLINDAFFGAKPVMLVRFVLTGTRHIAGYSDTDGDWAELKNHVEYREPERALLSKLDLNHDEIRKALRVIVNRVYNWDGRLRDPFPKFPAEKPSEILQSN